MLQQLRGLKSRKATMNTKTDVTSSDMPPVAVETELTESEFSFTGQGHELLVIAVHEARNLVAKDYDTHSSDPFVKVTLAGCSRKTRVIYRNCHPLWEQRLVIPIAGVPEGEPLLVELFDKDFRAKEFLGQVMMTLGKALEIAADPALGQQYWFSVSKQRSMDIVSGELCLGFQVIDAVSNAKLLRDLECQLDGEYIASSLAGKALHVQLKGLNGLRASGLLSSNEDEAVSTGLSLFIKFGRLTMEKPLPPLPPQQDSKGSSNVGEYELPVYEEVVIPLEAALRTAPLAARRKDELCDVKLYLKRSDTNTTIAKTQIPIWDIPAEHKAGLGSTLPADAVVVSPAAGEVGITHGSTLQTPHATQDIAAVAMPTAERLGSSASVPQPLSPHCGTGSASNSAPSTPRGTRTSCTGDFTLASYRGPSVDAPSPRSPMQLSGSLDDLLARSKSDIASQLSCNSHRNLSQLSTVLGGNQSISCGRVGFVEGSLSSVTYGRVQGPAGPAAFGKKKVHNLGEINDFKTAFRSILTPPKEVSRMGWVPSRRRCEDDALSLQMSDVGCKHYCRTLEGYVPMYGNLEIGLGLHLVYQMQAAAADGTCNSLQEGDLTVDYSDDEEAPDATPLTAPEPYDLVLQDVTVQTGVNRLHSMLLGSRSEVMSAHLAAEGLTDLQVGPWQLAAAGGECLRSRQVSYTKKLNIPIPLAPKQCQVWEEHRLLVKQDGGFVAQHICTNNAPKGDCFRAVIQICGLYITSSSSRLRISMKLDWHKNTLGKGMVQAGAEADSKRGWGNLVNALQQHIKSRGISDSGAKSAAAAAEAPAVASATAATSVGGLQMVHGAVWDNKQLAVVSAVVALAVLLLMLLLLVGVWDALHELQQLNAVVKTMSEKAHPATFCKGL